MTDIGGQVLKEKSCKWMQDEDGNYETDCGEMFTFTEGRIKENLFLYCPYCGGRIVE